MSKNARNQVEVLSKLTIAERLAYGEAFGAMREALALPPSYERALRVRMTGEMVARVQQVMDEAVSRPDPEAEVE